MEAVHVETRSRPSSLQRPGGFCWRCGALEVALSSSAHPTQPIPQNIWVQRGVPWFSVWVISASWGGRWWCGCIWLMVSPSSDCDFPLSPGPTCPGSHPSPSVSHAGTPSHVSSAPAARGSWRTTSRREVACVSSTCPTPRTWWWDGNVATAFWKMERTVTVGRWRYGAGQGGGGGVCISSAGGCSMERGLCKGFGVLSQRQCCDG